MTNNTLQREIGDAQHALDWNQLIAWRDGFGHVSGGEIERLGGLDLEVPADATVLVDGDEVAVDEENNTVTVDPDSDYPRWGIVSVEADGTVAITHGDADELTPATAEPLQARVPSPPADVPGTIYAAVWVRANAVEIQPGDVFDRRFGSAATLGSLSVESEPTADTDVVRKAEADAKADLPIETDDLSDDAVTAAKIAAAAVDSEAISDGAVGVSELMDALGTTETTPIPGTTHFANTDADSTSTDEITGSVTSDPIQSLTDGELFVDSGVLTLSPSGGPDIAWVQNGDPISVILNSDEQTTVPSDEVWLVGITMNDQSLEVDGNRVTAFASTFGANIQKIVFDGDRTILNDGNAGVHIHGWEVSGLDVDFVTGINPTVPSGETWVGGLIGTELSIDNSDILTPGDDDYKENYIWTVLTENQGVSGQYETYFGGIKI